MHTGWNSVSLDSLGVLRASGADVVPFLQGQLSNDLERLAPERSLLAGYHNAQGRVIALLRLVQAAPGEVLAVLPRELAAAVASRLAKFILRAKVRVADESAAWQIAGIIAPAESASPATPPAGALPHSLHGVARFGGSIDRKSTRLNSSHGYISYAVFCLKKKNKQFSPITLLDLSPTLL